MQEPAGCGARSARRREAWDAERTRGKAARRSPGPGGSAPPLLAPRSDGGAGRTAGRSRTPRGRTRRTCQPGAPRAGPPAAAVQTPQYLYPGSRPHGPSRGGGGGLPERPLPAPCGPALPHRGPHLGRPDPPLGPVSAAHGPGGGTGSKGGPPCGKRRHGRSCSVNESNCLGDRGLPGVRHAKGGGGGERRGRGREEEEKARAAATASQPGCAPTRESEIKGI